MQGQHGPSQEMHLLHKRATKFHCKMDKYSCTREESPFSLGQSQSMPLPWCGWEELSLHWCHSSVWAVLASSEHPQFNTLIAQNIHNSKHPQLRTSTAQDIHSLGRATPESPLLTALWHCQESATHTPWFYKNPWIVQVPGEASLRYQNVPVLECTRETLESNTFCPGAEGCGSTDDLEHSPFTVTTKGGINVLALCTVRPYSPEHRAHTDTTLLLMQS